MFSPDLPHGIINFIWKEYLGKTRDVFLSEMSEPVEEPMEPLKLGELEDLRTSSTLNTTSSREEGEEINQVTSEDEPKVPSEQFSVISYSGCFSRTKAVANQTRKNYFKPQGHLLPATKNDTS